jgi:general secretion pathway protein A
MPYYNRTVQPPASLKALGDPIYEAFYGLSEQPFAITTDPRFFYLSASHQRAFSELLNGLRRRESMMLLTGDSGTGKTTLCRAVLQTLGERTFSAMILNPYMAGAEVFRIVLRDFGLVTNEDLRRGALATADVPQLLDTLEGFLKSLMPLGSHAVIVMDEAQSLAPAILDQIRLLTSLEHNRQRLVQVVLCGQPGLLNTLKAEPLHALNERITRRVELSSLPLDEVTAYIEHRLGVAGGLESIRFDPAAAVAIGELSRGLPRRVNVLCDRALQEGRVEGVNVITADLVKRAARARGRPRHHAGRALRAGDSRRAACRTRLDHVRWPGRSRDGRSHAGLQSAARVELRPGARETAVQNLQGHAGCRGRCRRRGRRLLAVCVVRGNAGCGRTGPTCWTSLAHQAAAQAAGRPHRRSDQRDVPASGSATGAAGTR